MSGDERHTDTDDGPIVGPALPPVVADAVNDAAQTYERLAAQGRELRFESDAATRRVVVEMHDTEGNPIRRLACSELFGMLREGA